MKSTILAVGTELLFGQVVNTNASYLSQQLNMLGIDVMYHKVVGDNPERVKEAMIEALEKTDIVITTGGLGPTQDDLTKEVAAEVMGDELVLDQDSLIKIETHFTKLKRIMTENNIRQAYLPKNGIIFNNEAGTAPGCALEKDGKVIICLPGPPREMRNMFEREVKPYLEKKSDDVIYSQMIKVFGIGESMVESELETLISAQTDPTIATYAKEGEVCVRVTSKRKTIEEAKQAVEEMSLKITEILGEYIYSYHDEELADVVIKKLMERNITVSCAESCTGGLFAATLTGVPGISAIFDRGIVTYSNRAKMEELGVRQETLDVFGAVSSETAVEMTEGLYQLTGSRLCISVTGVAGPSGGSDEKPVGLSYICVRLDDAKVCNEYRMRSVSRNWNRNYTVLLMLTMINKLLEGK